MGAWDRMGAVDLLFPSSSLLKRALSCSRWPGAGSGYVVCPLQGDLK